MGHVSRWKRENNVEETSSTSPEKEESTLVEPSKLYNEPFCLISAFHTDDKYNKQGKWKMTIRYNDTLRHFYINGANNRSKMIREWIETDLKKGNLVHGLTLVPQTYVNKRTGEETEYPEISDSPEPICPCGVMSEETLP